MKTSAYLGSVAALLISIVMSAVPLKAQTPPAGWQGFYVGAAAGARFALNTWTTTSVCPTSSLCVGGPGLDDRTQAFDSTGVRVGAFGGHNWSIGTTGWLAGIEADLGWGSNRRSNGPIPGTTNSGGVPAVTAGDTASVNLSWDASLRARAGNLVLPGTLLFATWGLAMQRIEATAACNNDGATTYCTSPPGVAHSESNERFLFGWTVGAGIEHQIAERWLVRVEYRYADFGNAGLAFFSSNVGAGGDDRVWANVYVRTHTVNLGMAYKF